MHSTTTNKQTDKGWVCAESLLKIEGASNQYGLIPHSPQIDFTNTTSFSISCVVDTSAVSTSAILYKRNTTNAGDANLKGIIFAYGGSTDKNFIFGINDGSDHFFGTPTMPTVNKLCHVVCTAEVSGSTMDIKIYVDGRLSRSGNTGTISSFSNTKPLAIGRYYQHSSLLQNTCLVGFVSIYNKALTSLEVDQLYNDISIIPKSLHANCVGFWTMQERTGAKAYDAVEQFNYAKGGSPLIPNHGDLIGYTTTELGTATNETTQTAKVDFYTKTVIDRTNGSGVEVKTGLPELKNVIKSTKAINFNTTNVKTIGTGNFSFIFSFYNPVDQVQSSGRLFSITQGGQYDIAFTIGRLLIFLPNASYYLNDIGIAATLPKGFYTYCLQKIGTRDLRFYINGRLQNLINTQSGDINKPYNPAQPDINLTSVASITSEPCNVHTITVGFTTENLTVEQQLKIHNNSMLANPYMRNYKMYYQTGNPTGNVLTNLALTSETTTLSNFTADELNPTHPSYVIKTINSLR